MTADASGLSAVLHGVSFSGNHLVVVKRRVTWFVVVVCLFFVVVCLFVVVVCLQCIDAVGWTAGRASGL